MKQLLIPRNNHAEMDALEDVCERVAGFEPTLTYEWIDGFLTGLASGPRLPATADWLKALMGDTFERVFADPVDQAGATSALQARLHVLCKQLDPEALFDDQATLRLEPLMEEWDDARRQELAAEGKLSAEQVARAQTGREWVRAFHAAREAFPELHATPADPAAVELFDTALLHLSALTWAPDSAEYQAHLQSFYPEDPPTRDDLIAQALWSVQDLRLFRVDFSPVTETIRVDAKPGRNDPCHCGSGKKFKKCHGA